MSILEKIVANSKAGLTQKKAELPIKQIKKRCGMSFLAQTVMDLCLVKAAQKHILLQE